MILHEELAVGLTLVLLFCVFLFGFLLFCILLLLFFLRTLLSHFWIFSISAIFRLFLSCF